jgi:hypothetical protein
MVLSQTRGHFVREFFTPRLCLRQKWLLILSRIAFVPPGKTEMLAEFFTETITASLYADGAF